MEVLVLFSSPVANSRCGFGWVVESVSSSAGGTARGGRAGGRDSLLEGDHV